MVKLLNLPPREASSASCCLVRSWVVHTETRSIDPLAAAPSANAVDSGRLHISPTPSPTQDVASMRLCAGHGVVGLYLDYGTAPSERTSALHRTLLLIRSFWGKLAGKASCNLTYFVLRAWILPPRRTPSQHRDFCLPAPDFPTEIFPPEGFSDTDRFSHSRPRTGPKIPLDGRRGGVWKFPKARAAGPPATCRRGHTRFWGPGRTFSVIRIAGPGVPERSVR